MLQYIDSDRVMDAETILKNRVSSKSSTSRRNIFKKACFTLLAAGVFLLITVVCSTSVMAQDEISPAKFMEQLFPLVEQFNGSMQNKDYQTAEKVMDEIFVLFNCLSKENQTNSRSIQAEMYYGRACLFSLQDRKNEAIDAFEAAVLYGFSNYSGATTDKDLDNIRAEQRFISIMEGIREKGDYVYIIRQAGKYQSVDTTGLPRFTYEASASNNLRNVKDFFKLDSIAGNGDEISKILNLMKWVQSNIRHNGSHFAMCEFDAIYLQLPQIDRQRRQLPPSGDYAKRDVSCNGFQIALCIVCVERRNR